MNQSIAQTVITYFREKAILGKQFWDFRWKHHMPEQQQQQQQQQQITTTIIKKKKKKQLNSVNDE